MILGYLQTESSAGVPPAGDLDGLPHYLAGHSPVVLKNSAPVKQSIVTLDMEGVLTPEIRVGIRAEVKIRKPNRTKLARRM